MLSNKQNVAHEEKKSALQTFGLPVLTTLPSAELCLQVLNTIAV
jgi:hypothetical protein